MESDHEYFWSKNNGPHQSQNHYRNAEADHLFPHLKDKAGIMKTYHVWSGETQFTNRYWEKLDRTEMSKDLKPFVVYSMNKRRNWEIEEMDSVELIRKIQDLHKGEDVMFLERVAMRTVCWPQRFQYEFLWTDFRIHKMHELDSYVTGRPEYRKTVVNSGRGQHPNHFLAYNRASNKEDSEKLRNEKLQNIEKEKRTVVAYHLIKSPDNYMSLFRKEFGRDNNHSVKWAPPAYWERKRKESSNTLDLRYEDYSDIEVDNDQNFDMDDTLEQEVVPKNKFYNLEDHIIEHFVYVKRKKNKKNRGM